MKLFCCYTPSHRRLFNDYFKPSLPRDITLVAHRMEMPGDDCFLSPGFLECIMAKLNHVVASLRENKGETLIWSDIDILFFRKEICEDLSMLMGNADMAFQREGSYTSNLNSGFFVVRATDRSLLFFEHVRDAVIANPGFNEEHFINKMLLEWKDFQAVMLPRRYYCRSWGWPPPKDMVLYHANCVFGSNGIEQKVAQFEHIRWVRQHGIPALAWSCVVNSRHRIQRLVGLKR